MRIATTASANFHDDCYCSSPLIDARVAFFFFCVSRFVTIEVDGDADENRNPKATPDDG